MPFRYEEFDLSGVRTYPLSSRRSKARAEDFAQAERAARRSRRGSIRSRPSSARRIFVVSCGPSSTRTPRDAGIVWGIGAHVIKTGVSPVLIDLMQRGYVSALAMNGAGVIHDFEIALSGATSEDVDEALGPGRFGMAEETGRILNEVDSKRAVATSRGCGQAVGAYLSAVERALGRSQPPRDGTSVLAFRSRSTWPSAPTSCTCIRMRPAPRLATPAFAISGTSRRRVARLTGGVYLNCGSAVVLPEVFLKAVALARNQGVSLDGLTTVNIDFMRHVSAADQRRDPPGGRNERGRASPSSGTTRY